MDSFDEYGNKLDIHDINVVEITLENPNEPQISFPYLLQDTDSSCSIFSPFHFSDFTITRNLYDEPSPRCLMSPPMSELSRLRYLDRGGRTDMNERERARTVSINTAFNLLRARIPTEPANRKLSKIEILRLASSYIKHLEACIHKKPTCTVKLRNNDRGSICTFCSWNPTPKSSDNWKKRYIRKSKQAM